MVEIIGIDGQPLRSSKPEREDQTSRIGWLHREIGEHPTRGLTPQRLAALYRRAEEGDLTAQAQLGMDMEEKDAHLFAELSKRRLAVQSVDWHIEPPKDASAQEKRAAEICTEILTDAIDLQDLLYDMTDAILHSYAGCEYHWQLIDGLNVPTQPEFRPPDWFQTDYHAHQYSRLLLRDQSSKGTPLRPLNWILHVQRSRSGYLTRAGLVRVLGWPFLMRALSTRDLAEFLEIYGLPLRLGKYPAGSTEKEKATLLRAVVGIGHAAAGIIPESMNVEFKEAAKGASGNPFMEMMQWAEGSISKAILGGTLTTSAQSTGLGSNLGEQHNECRKEIAQSDRRQLKRTIEKQLLAPITALNTTAERAPLFIWDDEEPADMKMMADALPGLVKSGLRISRAWVHDRLKVPEAEDADDILQAPEPPSPEPPGAASSTAAANVQPPDRPAATDAQTAQLKQLGSFADRAIEGWIDQIREIVNQAESLEDLVERINQLFPEIDEDGFAEILGDAMAAAHMAGRYDILQGA
jgi:phage gp29-like protein